MLRTARLPVGQARTQARQRRHRSESVCLGSWLEMAYTGQVRTQAPHWTQRLSPSG